ncbi:hypothetical protein ACVWYH_006270 [Bradyrhizobium sp. GM24.11]
MNEMNAPGVAAGLVALLQDLQGSAEQIVADLPIRDRLLADFGELFGAVEDLAAALRLKREELGTSPIGRPSRMRLSAPTDGFIWLDSISEIVELVTPARLASSRCDSLWRARMNRSRPPMSTLMPLVLLQVLRIAQIWTGRPSEINGLQGDRKGLVALSKPCLC